MAASFSTTATEFFCGIYENVLNVNLNVNVNVNFNVNVEETSSHYINIEENSCHCMNIEETSSLVDCPTQL